MGGIVAPGNMWDVIRINFFVGFDRTIFQHPFAFGPGEGSYWSLQYVTLHTDYYKLWFNTLRENLPATSELQDPAMPVDPFNLGLALQYEAVPLTLILEFAFCY